MANSWLDMSNWKSGAVTFASAIGLGSHIKFQTPTPIIPAQVDAASPLAAGAAVGGAAGSATQSVNATIGKSTGQTAQTALQGGTPTPPANSSENAFWKAVLASLGAPATQANINSLNAWAQKESIWPGGPNKGGLYNPLNTTLSQPGATNYNSVGVKNFVSPASGVVATVQTLLGGYPAIVSALKSGQGLCGDGAASAEFSKWSGGGYSSVC